VLGSCATPKNWPPLITTIQEKRDVWKSTTKDTEEIRAAVFGKETTYERTGALAFTFLLLTFILSCEAEASYSRGSSAAAVWVTGWYDWGHSLRLCH